MFFLFQYPTVHAGTQVCEAPPRCLDTIRDSHLTILQKTELILKQLVQLTLES